MNNAVLLTSFSFQCKSDTEDIYNVYHNEKLLCTLVACKLDNDSNSFELTTTKV